MALNLSTVLPIPERLIGTLKADPGVYGDVLSSISSFTPWLVDNKLPFFPDYTDHGIDHISSVLIAASSLIRDEAWQVMTARDAATIVMSTLLHDIAMHLSEDGFMSLITSKYSESSWETPWPIVWQSFLGEAFRFDDKKLRNIFGDTVPPRRPPTDPLEFTKRDRLLIGEFVRRHHARLAHEIAIFGVPGPSDDRLAIRFAY